jgi:hypothetical protein
MNNSYLLPNLHLEYVPSKHCDFANWYCKLICNWKGVSPNDLYKIVNGVPRNHAYLSLDLVGRKMADISDNAAKSEFIGVINDEGEVERIPTVITNSEGKKVNQVLLMRECCCDCSFGQLAEGDTNIKVDGHTLFLAAKFLMRKGNKLGPIDQLATEFMNLGVICSQPKLILLFIISEFNRYDIGFFKNLDFQ